MEKQLSRKQKHREGNKNKKYQGKRYISFRF